MHLLNHFYRDLDRQLKLEQGHHCPVSCKIGDESMEDADLAINAHAIISVQLKKNCQMEKKT